MKTFDVPFTQYLMPDGRKRDTSIAMPIDLKPMVDKILNAGYRFEIEMLTTGEISMEVADPVTEDSLAMEICKNGPEVPISTESLIKEAAESLNHENKT